MPPVRRPRILFVDAYDSFSNNIVSLLTTLLDVDVFVLPIDDPLGGPGDSASAARELLARELLARELSHYDAVVCGPGPGSPDHEADVGLMRHIWACPDDANDDGDGSGRAAAAVPALGICLGFQSLVTAHGARVRRLRRGLHGMVRAIDHAGVDVFAGVPPFRATLYHSLGVVVDDDDGDGDGDGNSLAGGRCPDLLPLAWVVEAYDNDGHDHDHVEATPNGSSSSGSSSSKSLERILMAVRHRSRPFWGLQYHPESVCTDPAGDRVLRNWFAAACVWNRNHRRLVVPAPAEALRARRATRPSLLSQPPPSPPVSDDGLLEAKQSAFHAVTLALPPHVSVPDIVEVLEEGAVNDEEHIVLDSANAHLSAPLVDGAPDVRGRYSIVALGVADAMRVEHHAGDDYALVRRPRRGTARKVPLGARGEDGGIWRLLADFQHRRHMDSAEVGAETPFVGGFMGYVTYEQGLRDVGVPLAGDRGHRRPDVCLVWVTKSVVVDHRRGLVHVQHLGPPGECAWAPDTAARLERSPLWTRSSPGHATCNKDEQQRQPLAVLEAKIETPQPADYADKVRTCQEYIAAGDSYELCLTDQTLITLPCSDPGARRAADVACAPRPLSARRSWRLFRSLRARQPAPFASYVRLGPATLVSASPERFLAYTAAADGGTGTTCSMRPMKGTVRKGPGVTRAVAEAVLRADKERAENLMIVDLARHDLHGVCGAGAVHVPHLMAVEEYASVFQMVTVVEGRLPPTTASGARGHYTGLDVLAASLPPGSMTGAPKKRSCEILRGIEGGAARERSLYSGVVGYMCATGRGDWSVTIRSLFRWDDEQPQRAAANDGFGGEQRREVWRIGAGGAVTILSTPEGETDEMFTKLAGPLGLFTDTAGLSFD